MNLNTLFFICFCIFSVQNIFLQINNDPFCLKVPAKKHNTYKVFYQSLEQHSSVIVQVKSQHFQTIKLVGIQNKTQFNGQFQSEICLKGQKQVGYISIDIYPTNISYYKQAAHKSQFYQVHEELIMLGQSLKEIARNIEFQQEKQAYHQNYLVSNSKIVRISGIIKVLCVTSVIFGQLYLLKRYMTPDF